LSKPQKTWTILNVADVTGSAKSPPGGETLEEKKKTASKILFLVFLNIYAPTMLTEPSRSGLPKHRTRPARS
jgi:hypothetical protein